VAGQRLKRGTVRRILPGALLGALLAACGAAPKPQESPVLAQAAGIVIRNELAYPVHDVLIEVPATGGFAGCGMILRRSQCSTSFPAAAYRGEGMIVRWTEYGEAHATDEFVLDLPTAADPDEALWVEVVIFASGQAGARLVSGPGP
jgi:hypothetical protein